MEDDNLTNKNDSFRTASRLVAAERKRCVSYAPCFLLPRGIRTFMSLIFSSRRVRHLFLLDFIFSTAQCSLRAPFWHKKTQKPRTDACNPPKKKTIRERIPRWKHSMVSLCILSFVFYPFPLQISCLAKLLPKYRPFSLTTDRCAFFLLTRFGEFRIPPPSPNPPPLPRTTCPRPSAVLKFESSLITKRSVGPLRTDGNFFFFVLT